LDFLSGVAYGNVTRATAGPSALQALIDRLKPAPLEACGGLISFFQRIPAPPTVSLVQVICSNPVDNSNFEMR
jgi:hypothetical protein